MTARWYIVHAYSNFEKKVAEDIENKAKQKGLSEHIEQIIVPTEKVVEVRRGRKVDAFAQTISAPVEDLPIELLVPVCGEHFAAVYPSVAVIGTVPPVWWNRAFTITAVMVPMASPLPRIICDHCGKHDHVSFQPKVGRPVLCRDCHEASRSRARHALPLRR